METQILSNGSLKYDPLYPLFCQRLIEESELRIAVPLSFHVEGFVFEFATVLSTGGQSDTASLLERRNNYSIEELSATIGFSRRLLTALSTIENPTEALTKNHFETLLLDVLQEEDINDIWNVRKTILVDKKNNNQLPSTENGAEQTDELTDDADSGAEVVAAANRATFIDALWNTVSRYELTGVYKAGLFQTALDQMNASSMSHFKETAFTWDNVAKFVNAVNAAYMTGRVGTTPAAFAQTLQELVKESAYVIPAFAQSLEVLFSVYDGPSILVPFIEVENMIRSALKMEPFLQTQPYSKGHSERYVRKLKDPLFTFKNGGKFLSFFDMIFRCMAIKAGRPAIKAGSLINQTYTVNELLSYYQADSHPSVSLQIPWPQEYGSEYKVDSEFEDKLFKEIYFHSLLKRILFKQMSTTAGRFMGLADEKRYNKDEPFATVINTNCPAIGNAYDAFIDTAQYFMTFLYDSNMYFDRPKHFAKYTAWLKIYLKMFTEVVEPLNSPKFFYGLQEILAEPSLLPVQIPSVMLADAVTNDTSKLIVNPTDFSYFRYFVGTQLTDFKIDLPLKETIDMRFLRQPYCSPMKPYFVVVYREPNYGPMTESVDQALRLDKLDSILSLGFNKFFLDKGEMMFIQDDLDMMRKTGLPLDFLKKAGVIKQDEGSAVSMNISYSKYLFKWRSSETRFLLFDLSEVLFFEVADRYDIFGNDVKFVATWPYLVRVTESSAPTSFEVGAGVAQTYTQENSELIATPVEEVKAVGKKTLQHEVAPKSETKPQDSSTVTEQAPESQVNQISEGDGTAQ